MDVRGARAGNMACVPKRREGAIEWDSCMTGKEGMSAVRRSVHLCAHLLVIAVPLVGLHNEKYHSVWRAILSHSSADGVCDFLGCMVLRQIAQIHVQLRRALHNVPVHAADQRAEAPEGGCNCIQLHLSAEPQGGKVSPGCSARFLSRVQQVSSKCSSLQPLTLGTAFMGGLISAFPAVADLQKGAGWLVQHVV